MDAGGGTLGFREKLLDLKRRLSDRKMYSIVIAIIGAVAIWGLYQYKHSANLRQELDNQYNRAFFDMVGYVNNVEVLMMKSLISGSPTKTAATLQEAWRQANLAQTNLGQLPVTNQALGNTSKFLTQIGDFSYSLNNQNMQGKPLSDQQYKTIEKLYGFAVSLGNSLNVLQSELTTGRIRWKELVNKGTPLFQKTSSKLAVQQVENIDKTFQEYPTLIYDGPFSDHLTNFQPRGLTGKNINADEGRKIVADFFGAKKVKGINFTGKTDGSPFRTFNYTVSFNGAPDDQNANISVTQKGGHVYQMLYERPSAKTNITVEKAKEMGRKFLESRGFKSMVDTYYTREDNVATINYAYSQDGVTVYPDLIKLKIALDDGEVIGFEAKGYLSAHTVRSIPKPKVTQEQARKLISPRVKVLSSGFAIIPTDFRTEVFTYEFKGKLNNRDFLVYINADNGKEENILMILDTPNGILTM